MTNPEHSIERALVTGASGFIGSHLVHRLREAGHHPLAMLRETSSRSNIEDCRRPEEIEVALAGLDDVEALRRAMEGCDIVFHIAGLTAAYRQEDFDRVNVEGFQNLLRAMSRCEEGPKRVVLCSSSMAAGPSAQTMARREQHRHVENFTMYGDSKLAAERAGWEAVQRDGLEVVVVRPPLVYGPRDQDVFQIIRGVDEARLITVPGKDDAFISAIHAHDLVDGIMLAGQRGRSLPARRDAHVLAGDGLDPHVRCREVSDPRGEGIYYLTDGRQHTVESFGRAVGQVLNKRALSVHLPRSVVMGVGRANELLGRIRGRVPALTLDKARGSLSSGWWYDDARARAELGYSARVDLRTGLKNTVDWLREHDWM
jgi:nucleoside-diphosphate-sugar epimerase